MARVRSKDTSPEIAVRRRLHAAGYRFRKHRADLPGRPDLVLPRFRIAVFIHGCFWHGHRCRAFRMPASNVKYWRRKISRNVERDARAVSALRSSGWRCRVIWACRLDEGIARLLNDLSSRG